MNSACPRCHGTGAFSIPTANPARCVWSRCPECNPHLLDQHGNWRPGSQPFWFGPASPGLRPDLAPVDEEPILYGGAPHDDDGPRNPN